MADLIRCNNCKGELDEREDHYLVEFRTEIPVISSDLQDKHFCTERCIMEFYANQRGVEIR